MTWLRPLAGALGALPPGFGQQAIARRVWARGRPARPGGLARQRLASGATVELDMWDEVEAQAFVTRRYQPALTRFIADRLQGGDVFFDVGAHIGLVTFQVAAAFRDRPLSIHAFEPHAPSAARLRRNHELNPSAEVTLSETAIGAGDEPVTLMAPLAATAAAAYVASGGDKAADTPPASVTSVPMTTLDRYTDERGIARVDVMKLDVEGFELEVIRGAERLLAEGRVGCVVCELNDVHLRRMGLTAGDVVEHMSRIGYVREPILGLGGRRLRRGTASSPVIDVVFVPDDAGRTQGLRQ